MAVEGSIVLIPRHLQPHLPPRHEPRVRPLVAEDRQHDQRVPVQKPFDERVPATVRQECPNGIVRQDGDLRNPPQGHQPAAASALSKVGGEDVGVSDAPGPPQSPEEARSGKLQPVRQLVHELHAQRHLAPEPHVHDGPGWLRVQPTRGGIVPVHAGAAAAAGGVDSQIWHLLGSTGLTGRADRSDRSGLYSPNRIKVFVKSPHVILLMKGYVFPGL
ncbi:hypothetical protein PVAP13_8KG352606 [Panicum virgatum]|uniref:Uncharacterized protein n=1 Tax=Panicum virgatum TaxID=38727 RepID=A0A8T0PSY5_PANVG|nr:hypothetical protein PVAP13_8KG352606 [Panicum virgatum]